MRSSFRPARRWFAVVAGVVVVGLGLVALRQSPVAAPYVGQYSKMRLAAPAGSAWSSSEKFGTWDNRGFDVYNNEWNTAQAGPQLVWADSYRHWGVQSVQPDSTSVKT
jgi:hypothetical protein